MPQQQFYSSKAEMNRRAKAFTTLASCWIIELALVATVSSSVYRLVAIQFTWLLGIALAALWIYTMYYLYYQHAHTRIQISGSLLTKAGRFFRRDTDLGKLRLVHIKYTTRGSIRRITLVSQAGKRLSIDGMDDFDTLAARILKASPKAQIIKVREKIDYDHVLFYPCLSLAFTALVSLALAAGVVFM